MSYPQPIDHLPPGSEQLPCRSIYTFKPLSAGALCSSFLFPTVIGCSLPPLPIPISDTPSGNSRPANRSPTAVSWNEEQEDIPLHSSLCVLGERIDPTLHPQEEGQGWSEGNQFGKWV